VISLFWHRFCHRVRARFADADGMRKPAVPSQNLSTPRGAALYIGALLGPGLLLLPGLAAEQAGPASILAWLALLGTSALLAVVFAALGKAHPSAAGVAGYTVAGLGARAGAAAGWCFLAGVICGAPIVCLIGAGYVADLTGVGQPLRCAIAAVLLVAVLGLALCGVRATTGVQMVLVALLIAVVILAVAGSAPSARAAGWTPFAPHGWGAIGRAASTLMLSFVGWEAVAPLTSRFPSPSRQLPRVIGAAFAATAAVYLGLAVAIIAVPGSRARADVPLAALLRYAVGAPGPLVAAVTAVLLTIGTTNAYLSGAAAMAATLARRPASRARPGPPRPFLTLIACAGLLVIGLTWLRLVTVPQMVTIPTTLFLAVYLGCTISALRTTTGVARLAAMPALAAVVAVMLFCGWALAVAAAVAAAAALWATGGTDLPGSPSAAERAAPGHGVLGRGAPACGTAGRCADVFVPGQGLQCAAEPVTARAPDFRAFQRPVG
jgi:amino acid efflux transporter